MKCIQFYQNLRVCRFKFHFFLGDLTWNDPPVNGIIDVDFWDTKKKYSFISKSYMANGNNTFEYIK